MKIKVDYSTIIWVIEVLHGNSIGASYRWPYVGLYSPQTHDLYKLIAQFIKLEQIILRYGLKPCEVILLSIYDFTKYLMYIPRMVQLNSLSKE
jgi:hypothetical protein